jgi:hypothetical protein
MNFSKFGIETCVTGQLYIDILMKFFIQLFLPACIA